MSISDKLRSFWDNKKDDDNPGRGDASSKKPPSKPDPLNNPSTPPAASKGNSRQEPQQVYEQEKKENENKFSARDKEIQDVRASLDKLDLEGKSRREEHLQTSQMLRMDAEREIKYLERKLQEDGAAWSKQLSDREKALEQAAQLTRTCCARRIRNWWGSGRSCRAVKTL